VVASTSLRASSRAVIIASTTCERHAICERTSTAAATASAWAIRISHYKFRFVVLMRHVEWSAQFVVAFWWFVTMMAQKESATAKLSDHRVRQARLV
jgi:hypothetical protein